MGIKFGISTEIFKLLNVCLVQPLHCRCCREVLKGERRCPGSRHYHTPSFPWWYGLVVAAVIVAFLLCVFDIIRGGGRPTVMRSLSREPSQEEGQLNLGYQGQQQDYGSQATLGKAVSPADSQSELTPSNQKYDQP